MWPFYKRFQLVYLNLSRAGDQAWCPDYMGKCLTTEPHPQSSLEKEPLNLASILSCLNIETIRTEILQVIKTFKQ
jgi:hypothetical protein